MFMPRRRSSNAYDVKDSDAALESFNPVRKAQKAESSFSAIVRTRSDVLPSVSQRQLQRKRTSEVDVGFALARDEHKKKNRRIGLTGLARVLGNRSYEDDRVLLNPGERSKNGDFQNHSSADLIENEVKPQSARVGTRANLNYLDQLSKFHKLHGNNLYRFPSVGKRPIDLYELKKAVETRGGFYEVCKQKKWAEIGRDLNYNGKIMSSLAVSLKNSYQKWLRPYEEYLTTLNPGGVYRFGYENGGPFTPSSAPSPVRKHTPSSLGGDSPAIRASTALNVIPQNEAVPPLEPPQPAATSGFTAANAGGFAAVNAQPVLLDSIRTDIPVSKAALAESQNGDTSIKERMYALQQAQQRNADLLQHMSHATSTPSIRIYDSGSVHSRIPRRSPYASGPGIPMAILNARESPPPPLPPPRYIDELSEGQDPGWQWGDSDSSSSAGFGRSSFGSIKPGSSLLGGGGQLRREGNNRAGTANEFTVIAKSPPAVSIRQQGVSMTYKTGPLEIFKETEPVLCIKYTISEDMTKGEQTRNKARLSAVADRPRILGSKRSSVLGFAHSRTGIEAHHNHGTLLLKDRPGFSVPSREVLQKSVTSDTNRPLKKKAKGSSAQSSLPVS